jgi:hypothetical protein
MYITLVFINVSPQSASAPPRSQIKQQPNTKGGQNKNTHSPPQLYQKLQFNKSLYSSLNPDKETAEPSRL